MENTVSCSLSSTAAASRGKKGLSPFKSPTQAPLVKDNTCTKADPQERKRRAACPLSKRSARDSWGFILFLLFFFFINYTYQMEKLRLGEVKDCHQLNREEVELRIFFALFNFSPIDFI